MLLSLGRCNLFSNKYNHQFILKGYPILDPKNKDMIQENGQVMSLLKVNK
jgi:hypothetical protein